MTARLLLRRISQLLPTALIVTFLVFMMTLALPGDPTTAILGEDASAEQREILREKLGLDRPAAVQYVVWLGGMATGDFGTSLKTGEPVADMLALRVPITVELTVLSMVLAVLIGIPAGVFAATRRGSLADLGISFLAMSSMAVPYFWAGMLLIMLFAVKLGWLPSSGYVPFHIDPFGNLRAMILPSITIGTAMAALVMRQTRAAMCETMEQDFIRTARAKGVRPRSVVYRHGLRNCLIPVTTVIGLQIGTLIGGAVVTETIFSLPGLGRMIVNGIFWRDFPVVQGGIVVIVFFVLLVNLVTDLAYSILDPRVRLS
ncbi:ABC transporter permease [Oceaniglobus trochenteri]|uniref:ABC transporter permease n=1 Tax=Oceaniglobus trochenteri TaxID=2763260 RepID=UPI001CFF5A49|nr:ABC transporter permease [Oceaniglobus trochenteri]